MTGSPAPGRLSTGERVRQLANLLNLSTPAGLLLAAATRTELQQGPGGLLLGTGYKPTLPLAGAFTVGNVILYRGERAFIDARPALLAHEGAHSTQYALCLGLPFLPLYAACALFSLWRTGDPGSRNFFERRAGLLAGGYRELPTQARFRRRPSTPSIQGDI
ncbi:hypothetical protein ACQCSX_20545 [Pseudarthrobacter sp. P1]|uniref:hypothetical protein n=1 Tax=Pseudarthrobacter sp. P1 TaxID=3418418 RepID=UPI003CEB8982